MSKLNSLLRSGARWEKSGFQTGVLNHQAAHANDFYNRLWGKQKGEMHLGT